jgi:hypothetical protein
MTFIILDRSEVSTDLTIHKPFRTGEEPGSKAPKVASAGLGLFLRSRDRKLCTVALELEEAGDFRESSRAVLFAVCINCMLTTLCALRRRDVSGACDHEKHRRRYQCLS